MQSNFRATWTHDISGSAPKSPRGRAIPVPTLCPLPGTALAIRSSFRANLAPSLPFSFRFPSVFGTFRAGQQTSCHFLLAVWLRCGRNSIWRQPLMAFHNGWPRCLAPNERLVMKILDVPQSGSMAGTTSSRNRFGQYRRTRATPVNPNSSFQGVVRARMSANAAAWRTLTSAQIAGWNDLGNSMTRTDSLGQSVTLTGFQAYCSVNNNNLQAGNATVANAPVLTTPNSIVTLAITLTAAAFSLAYTVTPLPAGARLFSYVSLQRSAGRRFESDYRLVAVSAAAAASPADIYAAYTARFGIPVVGNRIFVQTKVYLGGFLSGPFVSSAVVA
jgi:hypothetical protein